jgi:hypothetical protein
LCGGVAGLTGLLRGSHGCILEARLALIRIRRPILAAATGSALSALSAASTLSTASTRELTIAASTPAARCRGCGCGRGGSGRPSAFTDLRHFEGPVFEQRDERVARRDLFLRDGELEHFDGDVPVARWQVQGVMAVFVGIGGELLIAADSGNGGAGHERIGRPDRAAERRGACGEGAGREQKEGGEV